MKKFKVRKNNKKKVIIFIFIILFFILFIWISLHKLEKSFNKYINFILNDTSFNEKENSLISKLTNNLDILLNNYEFIENNELVFKEDKKIYLYNTHDKEMYNDNTSILTVSNMLYNNLKKVGINSIIEEKRVSNYLDTNSDSYNISRKFINEIREKNNISYYVDIHRDTAIDTKVNINNKDYAKILFVLGLDNPNYHENKKVLEEMNNYLNEFFPGISKGIYEKKGSGVNGVYNQDLDKNVILIEVGGIENNNKEVNNSTEILALMFYHMLGD